MVTGRVKQSFRFVYGQSESNTHLHHSFGFWSISEMAVRNAFVSFLGKQGAATEF